MNSRFFKKLPNAEKIYYSHNSKKIAIATGTVIQIWDIQTEEFEFELEDSYFYSGNLEWSSDDKLIACAKLNKIQVWDTITGKIKKKLEPHTLYSFVYQVSFSPNSEYIASCSTSGLIIENIKKQKKYTKCSFHFIQIRFSNCNSYIYGLDRNGIIIKINLEGKELEKYTFTENITSFVINKRKLIAVGVSEKLFVIPDINF